jgi:hypothetical protein
VVPMMFVNVNATAPFDRNVPDSWTHRPKAASCRVVRRSVDDVGVDAPAETSPSEVAARTATARVTRRFLVEVCTWRITCTVREQRHYAGRGRPSDRGRRAAHEVVLCEVTPTAWRTPTETHSPRIV